MYLKATHYLKAGMGLVALLIVAVTISCGQQAPQRPPGKIISTEQSDGEWRRLNRDLAYTRYSPLDQINAENVATLEVAWRWNQGNFGRGPSGLKNHLKSRSRSQTN